MAATVATGTTEIGGSVGQGHQGVRAPGEHQGVRDVSAAFIRALVANLISDPLMSGRDCRISGTPRLGLVGVFGLAEAT